MLVGLTRSRGQRGLGVLRSPSWNAALGRLSFYKAALRSSSVLSKPHDDGDEEEQQSLTAQQSHQNGWDKLFQNYTSQRINKEGEFPLAQQTNDTATWNKEEQLVQRVLREIPKASEFVVRKQLSADKSLVLRAFLMGHVNGLGPNLVQNIVDFMKSTGDSPTLKVLRKHVKDDPTYLTKINGIGKKKAEEIIQKLNLLDGRTKSVESTWVKLAQLLHLVPFDDASSDAKGLVNLCNSILRRMNDNDGPNLVKSIIENPYYLLELKLFSFERVDKLAAQLGLSSRDPFRIQAAIEHVLNTARRSGHTMMKEFAVIRGSEELLRENASHFGNNTAVERPECSRNFVVKTVKSIYGSQSERCILLWSVDRQETKLVSSIERIQHSNSFRASLDYAQLEGWSQEQLQAIQVALTNKISVITGGPGTGKSWTISGLCQVLTQNSVAYKLTALTGRVAERLRQLYGLGAGTIHSLLQWNGENFFSEKLDGTEFLILDETSMVDLSLAEKLVSAVPSSAHLVFVGDVDQLPPIGAGAPFRDMISSGQIPVTRLTFNHRQSTNEIARYAHLINAGNNKLPWFCDSVQDLSAEKKIQLLCVDSPQEMGKAVLDVLVEFIGKKLKRDPIKGVQVLGPRFKKAYGYLSCVELNDILQSGLNPRNDVLSNYRVGDKIMCTKNDYNKDVMNGSIGYVEKLYPDVSVKDPRRVHLDVNMEKADGSNKLISFTADETDDSISLAYAMTCHKAQGCEYSWVVFVLTGETDLMLTRSLLYSAVTRAKDGVILVGSKKAYQNAVGRLGSQRRSTLAERLQGRVE